MRLGCPAGGPRIGAQGRAERARCCCRRRADVSRAWVAALHFDYGSRFLCYSFGMGECNDLSPAINAEFMYLERLGPLCSS